MVIAAGLDGAAIDEIDRSSEQRFQFILQIEKTREIIARRTELDQKIHVARRNVEIRAARGGTEHVEPPDAIAAAQVHEAFAVFGNRRVHQRVLFFTTSIIVFSDMAIPALATAQPYCPCSAGSLLDPDRGGGPQKGHTFGAEYS